MLSPVEESARKSTSQKKIDQKEKETQMRQRTHSKADHILNKNVVCGGR